MGNPVVHFEIGCRDSAASQAFYSKLFEWSMSPMGPAALIDTGASSGIKGHINSLGHEPHNYVTVYVEVEDLQATIDQATALGGKLLVPPIPIPQGHFAWIADPEGTLIGLIRYAKS